MRVEHISCSWVKFVSKLWGVWKCYKTLSQVCYNLLYGNSKLGESWDIPVRIIILTFQYNACSDWLKQHALSECIFMASWISNFFFCYVVQSLWFLSFILLDPLLASSCRGVKFDFLFCRNKCIYFSLGLTLTVFDITWSRSFAQLTSNCIWWKDPRFLWRSF